MAVPVAVANASFEEVLPCIGDPSKVSKSQHRQSKPLSPFSLSDKDSNDTASKALTNKACCDIARELVALETRLRMFQEQTQHHGTSHCSVTPLKVTTQGAHVGPDKDERYFVPALSSVSSNKTNPSSSIFLTLSNAQQEVEAVADQVATTLQKCDQLLLRAKSCDTSCVASVDSKQECCLNEQDARKMPRSPRLSDFSASEVSSLVWAGTNALASEDEVGFLKRKVAAVKRLGARCQRDIESSSRKVFLHQRQTQAAYLKELQRKYESKKQMTLMKLCEKYEKETKALVNEKVKEYEIKEATAIQTTQKALIDERNQTLRELQNSHNAVMEDRISQLELELENTTKRVKRELSNKLQEELSCRLMQIQSDNDSFLKRSEVEQRRRLEEEMNENREVAMAVALKTQEKRTAELKQDIQASHLEREKVEIQKLNNALAFGAQAQLQQLRKLLETDYSKKVLDIETKAALALKKETKELNQILGRFHQEQREQLQRDLEKSTRVAVMELHDSMQVSQRESLQALREEAEQRKAQAIAANRQDFEQKCRQELQTLEQTLQQELSAKLRQLEINHSEECQHKLDQLRARAVNVHARELEAKQSRIIQCKNVLLAEATAFLTFDNKLSNCDRNNTHLEDSAAAQLLMLKKHLSKQLAHYVDVMVSEFDELAEEHHILVAKITESTQLYLSFKRQCGMLEAQTVELSDGLETLHEQLQRKDAVCKKLNLANKSLLKRIQTPTLNDIVVTDEV